MPHVNKFTLGCDPEFMIIDPDGTVNMSLEFAGPVGSDHGNRVVELRPPPAYLGGTIIRRLARLMRDSERLRPMRTVEHKWISGPYGGTGPGFELPLGGHVHFGMSPYVVMSSDTFTYYATPMDNFVRITQSLELFDEPRRAARAAEGFGRYGNIRVQRYALPGGGAMDGFEYRTLPSWLFDPRVGLLCITGLKLSVVSPRIWSYWQSKPKLWEWVWEVLASVANVDSDALKLCSLFAKEPRLTKWQTDDGKDFRKRWGNTFAEKCPEMGLGAETGLSPFISVS